LLEGRHESASRKQPRNSGLAGTGEDEEKKDSRTGTAQRGAGGSFFTAATEAFIEPK